MTAGSDRTDRPGRHGLVAAIAKAQARVAAEQPYSPGWDAAQEALSELRRDYWLSLRDGAKVVRGRPAEP